MAGTTTQQRSSSGGWFACCVRPAVEEDNHINQHAAVNHHQDSSKAVVTANGTPSTHVTAYVADVDSRDATTTTTTDAPGSRDQGHTGSAAAEPGPASAAAAGSIAAVMAAKMASQNKGADQGVAVRAAAPHIDLKHLMASAHEREYTDADWDACLVALEQVKQQNQTLALAALQNGQQQRAGAGGALHRSSFTSANSDVWHDAFSHTMSDTSGVGEADHREIEQYLAELEMLRGPAPGPELACTPSCVPNPPLMFAPAHWKYCQVDARPFCAYWDRDYTRSTGFPLPIDKLQKINKLAMICHESIPGTWLHMEGNQLLVTATPTIMALPGMVNYNEYYNTDSTQTMWHLRRDISIGRSQGQMYMTTDGILVFRVYCIGMFGKTADCILEDYMRVEDNGNVIITKQYCHHVPSKQSVSQYLIGRRNGNQPPSAKYCAEHAKQAHKHM